MDAGDIFLNNPQDSEYIQPVQNAGTGFMQKLKNLTSTKTQVSQNELRIVDEDIKSDSYKENVQKDYQVVDLQQQSEGEQDQDSDTQKVIDLQQEDGALSDMEISDGDDDGVKTFRFHHPSTQQLNIEKAEAGGDSDDFIKFDFSADMSQLTGGHNQNDDNEGGLEDDGGNTRKMARKSRFTKYHEDWKDGLRNDEIPHKVREIIHDICVISHSVPWCKDKSGQYQDSNLSSILQQEILDLVDYLSPTDIEHKMRQYVILRTKNAIHSLWPEAEVQVFGSFDTRLYLPSSDIDIVIFIDDYLDGSFNAHRKLARKIKLLGLAQDGSVQIIPARIPLVKFQDSICHFSIDISFNIQGGVRSSSIIKQKIDLHPALRPLMIVMKQFLLMRGLNEVFSGGLGSYGLTALIVSFLQLHPWIQGGHIVEMENLNVLLLEFFDLYGRRFNYDDVGISLLDGGSYFKKEFSHRLFEAKKQFQLTIEDPEDVNNNITKGTFNWRMIVKSFARAFEVLSGAFYELDEIYVKQQSELDQKYQKQYGFMTKREWEQYEVYSILGSVIEIDQGLIERRKFVESKYHDLKEFIEGSLSAAAAVEESTASLSTGSRSLSQQRRSEPQISNRKRQAVDDDADDDFEYVAEDLSDDSDDFDLNLGIDDDQDEDHDEQSEVQFNGGDQSVDYNGYSVTDEIFEMAKKKDQEGTKLRDLTLLPKMKRNSIKGEKRALKSKLANDARYAQLSTQAQQLLLDDLVFQQHPKLFTMTKKERAAANKSSPSRKSQKRLTESQSVDSQQSGSGSGGRKKAKASSRKKSKSSKN
ncbi:hypothetical protein MIR68_007573 [Amoeboaphelidium protococcarum]|nr:hypothetical protein MIR68_007573 [Amoeboaphelidium protococcarum]